MFAADPPRSRSGSNQISWRPQASLFQERRTRANADNRMAGAVACFRSWLSQCFQEIPTPF
jgi:hypothetical protein